MKQTARYLLSIFLFYLLIFWVGKIGFILYNQVSGPAGLIDVMQIGLSGLQQDLIVSSVLTLIPLLFQLLGVWSPRLALKRLLRPYFIVVGLVLTLVIAADIVLYANWQFKLDNSVYNYLTPNNGAAESVSTVFLVGCFVALVVLVSLFSVPAIRLTPRKTGRIDRRIPTSVCLTLVGLLILIGARGVGDSPRLSVGDAYYSTKLFFNHAAVNPLYSLAVSTLKMRPYAEQYRYMSDEDCDHAIGQLMPAETEDVTEHLLRVERPNVLFIQLESCGSQFIGEIGGDPAVCPEFSRLSKEGILFDQLYANSVRTDRGTVSVLSGYVAYPSTTLMRYSEVHPSLSSIARSLEKEGYTADFNYGGNPLALNKQAYMEGVGITFATSRESFPTEVATESSWGAHDGSVFNYMLNVLRQRPADTRWFSIVQTMSSHEPFDVPYQRLDDKVKNAFAYTDHCLGQFIDSLRQTPLWDSTLIVIYSDHGMMHETSFENPEFFHIPLLWLGGAINEPRVVHTIMGQNDIAATLLSQMGISHKEYVWSRNVFSSHYTHPFAYCSYPSGVMFKDSTGVTIYDTNADRVIMNSTLTGSTERLHSAQSILQHSYDLLGQLWQKVYDRHTHE